MRLSTTRCRLVHRASWVALAVVLTGVAATGATEPSAQRKTAGDRSSGSPLDQSRQLLLVITDGWNSVGGTAQRFERHDGGGRWRTVGAPVPIVVGRAGLAWGRGLHAKQPGDGPIKKEGDGKAPAGAFRLAKLFGQSAGRPPSAGMPYQFLGNDVECVDDVRSTHYNELVTRHGVDRVDWNSSEKMWQEPLYKWGVVVAHNTGPAEPSAGSCIFLHIWRGPASGTAGCTAMAESHLLDAILWFDAGRKPILVQLPRDEYNRLKAAWGLP